MKRIIVYIIALAISSMLLSQCSKVPSDDEKIVAGWIPERSYFLNYRINQDKIRVAYSVYLFNETEDPVDISIAFCFRKKDLKGWLQYQSLFFAEDENGESYVTIKPMTKGNYTFYFEGTYLGGTVNEKLYTNDIMMILT